jgi:hypothetical protein
MSEKPMALVVRRTPKADNLQRRHLLGRIEAHANKLSRRQNAARNAARKPEPPEIIEARRLVDAYEEAQEELEKIEEAKITKVSQWLKERALFAPWDEALHFVKQFEALSLEEIEQTGSSMQDRNDVPVALLGGAS